MATTALLGGFLFLGWSGTQIAQTITQIGRPTTPALSVRTLKGCVDIFRAVGVIRHQNGEDVVTTYQVNGVQYTKQECLNNTWLMGDIQVRYNPDNPRDAGIDQDTGGVIWIPIGIELAAGIYGVYSGLFGGTLTWFFGLKVIGTYRGLLR